jgi:pimeloyl-ACP methyl ester carboxylesterase
MDRRVDRYATAGDGTRLWWTSAGARAPALVLCDGVGCAGYVWRKMLPLLSARHRILHWNYRGHGRSAAPDDPARVTVADCASDLLAVLDAAGEQAAVLVGHSMGVQVALETHRRAPGRVLGLALVCGAPGRAIDAFHDSGVLRAVFPWARAAVERFPEAARTAFRALLPSQLAMEVALAFEVDRTRVEREDLVRYFEDLSRIDPRLFTRLLASAAEHDAAPHLAAVAAPTLVVAGERDRFTPLHRSVAMQQAIPECDLLVIPGATHVAPLEHPEAIAARLLAFVAERVVPSARRRRAPSRPRRTARRGR